MITYLIEVSICWLLFYSIYIFLLSKETFFNINRWYLLSTLILGLLIPLFTVEFSFLFYQEPTNSIVYLAEGFSELEYVVEASVEEAKTVDFSWLTLLTLLYIIGVIVTFIRFLHGFRQIYGLYKEGKLIKKGKYNLVLTKTAHLPFSFFNYLFWNEASILEDRDSGKIITHELAHINQWHSLDVLLLEFLGIGLWFSPPIYWYKKSLRAVHEYLADAYVLRNTKKKQYGHLLIRQVQSGMQVALANNFIHSQLKQRINMMTRNKSRRKALTRYLPALPLLLLMILVFSNKNIQQNFNETTVKASLAFDNMMEGEFDSIKAKAQMRIAYRDGSKGWFTENGEAMNSDTQKMKELDRESKQLIAKYPEEETAIIRLTMEVAAENGYSLHYVGESMRYQEIKDFKKGEAIKMIMAKENLTLPVFFGGKEEMKAFIYSNINWPTIIEKERIYGLINTTFLIKKDGSMTNVEITSDLDKSINQEVMRVLKLMQAQSTKWTPARIDGKAIDMGYDLPFNIRQEGYDDKGIWFDKGEEIRKGITWNYFTGFNQENLSKVKALKVVDEKPRFPGGEKELLRFIYTNIKYPAEARSKGIYGEMIAQFTIEKDGSMHNLKVKNDLGGGLKAEILRVLTLVQEMPEKWTPATKNGEAVRFTYELPFEYHLKDENGDSPAFTKIHKGIHIVIIGYKANKDKVIKKTKDKTAVRLEKIDKDGVAYYRTIEKADNQAVNPIIMEGKAVDGEQVYKIADEKPRFPGCGSANDYNASLKKCGDKKMLQFLYENINYPKAAREQGIEGTVVVRFIVKKDGRISDGEILRNIGGGTGEEALRVVRLMNEKNIKWIPGLQDGQPINFNYNLPVKFRLENKDTKNEGKTEIQFEKTDENGVKHYRTVGKESTKQITKDKLMDGEPIYNVVDEMPRFPGCEGEEGNHVVLKDCADMKMLNFVFEHIKYPEIARKKGIEGTVVIRFLVKKDGIISDAEIIRNVGGGTGEEALRVVNLMAEKEIKWIPGRQDGKAVNVNFNLPVKFKLADDVKAEIAKKEATEKATEQPKDLLKRGLPEENVTLQLGNKTLILNAFPNPAREKLTITLEGAAKDILVTVFDATGKEYYRKSIQTFDGLSYDSIDLNNVPKGMLIVNIRHKGKDYQKKVIVQ